ncbi:MAG TPA: cell division protein ZipA [Xanthomonadaceae bacterium]|nr:cell division protein ZipA [Xanthomonadaceae bacterium]
MTQGELRLILLVIGIGILAAIWLFARPRRPGEAQGRRNPLAARKGKVRVEPVLEGDATVDDEFSEAEQPELVLPEAGTIKDVELAPRQPRRAVKVTAATEFERIVTLFVTAREGHAIRGPELVVAAEKAGLEFGELGIYHRLIDGKPEAPPVFSVASMVEPGSFDLANLDRLQTPGLTLFMTLPGPMSALDMWDAMLPTAQRLAELLDAQVLDDKHNALGRQGIAHIRDDLRAFDRKQDKRVIKPGW